MRKLRPLNNEALRSAIVHAAQASGDMRFMHRLHAVLLVSVGRTCYEVATWFGENPRSIERWIHAYEHSGPDGLRDRPRAGRPALLSAQDLIQVRADLASDPRSAGFAHPGWSGKLLALHLERRFGAHLSTRHCQRLLMRWRP